MDVVLRTLTWNPDGARRALVLHGLGSDSATVWRLAGHLAEHGFAVTAPDLRGHGSSPPARSYTLDELVADVRRLGSGWDLVVGHSLGGAIATVLLAEGAAARGVLIDPVIVLTDADRVALLPSQLAEVGGTLTTAACRAANPRWDDEDVLRKVRASAAVSPRVVEAILAEPWDLTDRALAWQVPVTVLAADPAVGALFTPAHAEALAGNAAAEIRTVEGAGHSIHRDDPAAVLAALDAAIS